MKNSTSVNVGQNNIMEADFRRYIVNDLSDGEIAKRTLEVLKKVIENHLPSSKDEDLETYSEILWFQRYACPCCQTGVQSIVRVGYKSKSFNVSESKLAILGMYSVFVHSVSCYEEEKRGSKFIIEKLTKHEFAKGSMTEHMPSEAELRKRNGR